VEAEAEAAAGSMTFILVYRLFVSVGNVVSIAKSCKQCRGCVLTCIRTIPRLHSA
jgi:hypothetical protein